MAIKLYLKVTIRCPVIMLVNNFFVYILLSDPCHDYTHILT
jgi:hypothetical protein